VQAFHPAARQFGEPRALGWAAAGRRSGPIVDRNKAGVQPEVEFRRAASVGCIFGGAMGFLDGLRRPSLYSRRSPWKEG